MIALSEIQKLSFHEKLATMEVLWDAIIQQENQLDVPQWHKDILDEREQLIQEGKAKFIDWEVAKKEIREAVS